MTSPTQPEVPLPEPAPSHNLPDWDECRLRCENSDFIAKRVAEGGYGPEADSKLATAVHRFIYEYDDTDPHRSAWFMHRLELALDAHAEAVATARTQALQAWRDEIENRLDCWHMECPNTPREALQKLIKWECAVVLDPSVSSDAEALVERGRQEVRAELDAEVSAGKDIRAALSRRIEALEAELERVRKDAERYRWLMNARTAEEAMDQDVGLSPPLPQDVVISELSMSYFSKSQIDWIVDAAMSPSPGGER